MSERAETIIKSLKSASLGIGLTTKDWDNLTATAERYLEAGWSSLDVRSYLRCTEELAPNLPEASALARMTHISSRYRGERKMVERAGTGGTNEPGIEDDSDLFDPEQKAAKASRAAITITTKEGLLWRDGELLGTLEADRVAQALGFMYAERLVTHLEKQQKEQDNG